MNWFESIPSDLTIDVDTNGSVQKVPVREHSWVKESPDLGHFVNKSLATQKEVGSRLPIKRLDKPEDVIAWRKDNLPKLWGAGLIDGPPKDAAGYEIKKPDDLHEGVNWDDARATKFAELGLKHNVSKGAMAEFLALHREAVTGTATVLKTSYEEGQLALKRELGDKYDETMELCKRFTPMIFKTAEERAFFDTAGIGDHPAFLSVMARLARVAQSDSSFGLSNENTPQGAAGGEALKAEIADIMGNPQNPKYKLYWAGDQATQREIDDKYKKVYGTGQTVIS